MIHITLTQEFGTEANLITELNTLPGYNRNDILEVKTYDGWHPMFFAFIKDTFIRVLIAKNGDICIMDSSKNKK